MPSRASSGSWLNIHQATASVRHQLDREFAGRGSPPTPGRARPLSISAPAGRCRTSSVHAETLPAAVERQTGQVPMGWARDDPLPPSRFLPPLYSHIRRPYLQESTVSVARLTTLARARRPRRQTNSCSDHPCCRSTRRQPSIPRTAAIVGWGFTASPGATSFEFSLSTTLTISEGHSLLFRLDSSMTHSTVPPWVRSTRLSESRSFGRINGAEARTSNQLSFKYVFQRIHSVRLRVDFGGRALRGMVRCLCFPRSLTAGRTTRCRSLPGASPGIGPAKEDSGPYLGGWPRCHRSSGLNLTSLVQLGHRYARRGRLWIKHSRGWCASAQQMYCAWRAIPSRPAQGNLRSSWPRLRSSRRDGCK